MFLNAENYRKWPKKINQIHLEMEMSTWGPKLSYRCTHLQTYVECVMDHVSRRRLMLPNLAEGAYANT